MLYAVANVILLLGCVIYRDWQEDRVVYLWYPLMAVCIGLAAAAKVHGIFFGLFWLALHIRKKYWKSHRDNFLFVLNCIILALVFCICNYSLFFHFKTFIGDNLYNLQHYAWGHPGIEHNLPLLGYTEAYVFTAYGAVGGLLFILGIVRLVREKDWQQLIVFLLMPVVILLMLSRYSIMLGRNVSLIVPFAILFMTYGLMEIERWLERYLSGKKKTSKKDKAKKQLAVMPKYIIDAAVALMILCNAAAVCNNYRYELSYNDAAAYIEEQMPEGATIYCTSYAPDMDAEKYTIIDIEEDISKLPEQLGENEYYVDVQYATGYFSQQKDYLVRQGCDMYPDLKKSYEDKVGQYTLLKQYQGITYGKEWKYRAGYLDFARFDPDDYYIGPTIGIYGK
jgi:NADH:ubiquinone oxidoreductase subunit 5 (subunit L)/multisubunit Na+/H+ antiporter MnhA subunit